MDNISRERWEKIRGKGRKHFIIFYGLLGCGLSTGIISFILVEILDHGLMLSKYFTGDWLKTLLIWLFSFLLCGPLFGYLMWGVNENFYHDKKS